MSASLPQEAPSRTVAEEHSRRALIAFVAGAFVATTTGTFIFCYPNTMRSVMRVMMWTHDLSGDFTILSAVYYLSVHLKKVWRMWRMVLSRWTGYVAVTVWLVAATTGVYGQFIEMSTATTVGLVHAISSIAAVVLASIHGGYGLRRYFT